MTELTEAQEEVLEQLPNDRETIADNLDISYRAVRYRMDAMEQNGYDFERDSDGTWRFQGRSDRKEKRTEEEPRRVNSYEKAQATKDIHNKLTEIEKDVKEALNNTSPTTASYDYHDSDSTLFLAHSDAHIGKVTHDRPGGSFYSPEEAKDRINEYVDRGIEHASRRGGVNDVVLLMNGDHLDGEGIFPGQRHEQEVNLRDQLRKASEIYINQILKLSEEFEFVDVYCVPGNHGRLDRESTTNADMILYDFIETALDHTDVDNVDFSKSENGAFISPVVRGWKFYCRHGQDYLEHVGTSSGKRRALSWYATHHFDAAIRSHYHSVKYEGVGDELPVVMTGCPAPPSTFAESQAEDGGRCGVYWFTTDENIIEDWQPVRFEAK